MVCRPDSYRGTGAGCTQASTPINELRRYLLVGNGAYDTQEILEEAISQDISVVISPKKNRKEQREYDKHLY